MYPKGKASDLEGKAGLVAEKVERGVRQTFEDRPLACMWCAWAIMVMVASSYTNGAGNAALGIPQFRKDFGRPYKDSFVLPAQWQSGMYGAAGGAAFVGALITGWVADKIGRKQTFGLIFAIKFASITLQVTSTSIQVFFGGMALGGFGWGGFCTLCTTYISEIAPLRLRGILTAAAPIAMTLGSFIGAVVVNESGKQSSRWAYRTVFVVGYGLTGFAVLFLAFAPESPWWLANKHEVDVAMQSLCKLNYRETEAEDEYVVIVRTLEKSKEEALGVSHLDCFRGVNFRRTIISVMPLAIHALSGVSFVASYSTYYQQLAGFSPAESFRLSIAQQIISMFGVVCSWFLIDRIGRRALTLWGMVFLTVLLLVTGGLAVAATPGAIKGTVALLLLYCYVFNLTIGATAYTIGTEAPTARLRIKTTSLAFATENALFTMWGFVLPYLFNPDKANLGAKVAFIFGGLSVLCTVYIWFYQPEFAGRSYEEMDELFRRKVPARKFGSALVDKEDSRWEVKMVRPKEEV